MNINIAVNGVSGGGVHSGHIQSTHYSSKSEDKIIYTFCIPIWRPSWISHFTPAIYYIALIIKVIKIFTHHWKGNSITC